MASSSCGIPLCVYDVFLSFRGSDTRYNFSSHLLDALKRQGFSTFWDDNKLEKGSDICCQLPRAISESRVSIVVFSQKYADSGWCLDELVKIMDCKRDFKQVVLPIFYNIDPTHVRRQTGFYAEAFKKHEDRFQGTSSFARVVRWREALREASNLSGWDLQNVVNRDEAKQIKKIVEEVINRLDRLYSDVADHPVGIDSRAQQLKTMLKLRSDDVCIVAIWGIGGIGKTTIAKAIFNSIRNEFEGSSFLADVRETSKIPSGVVALQKQLLSNILMNETHNLDNYHQGVDVIKRKLCHQRVLLVIDDVDHIKQLKMLALNRDLFCKGSRIIITTRNMSSLIPIQVDSVYSPPELNEDESLKLFSLNAFNTDCPHQGYSELSKEVVAYTGGLPLAIEVLGSFFSGRSQSEWASGLEKLKRYPHDDIQGNLKISFESLDKKDKDLFLDIAFFFIGKEKDFTVKVLEDKECFPEIGISELACRCLVQVGIRDKLTMHNLLLDMAREIVREESLKEPGERSRLGVREFEEILHVLGDCTGTNAIEGMRLELPESNDEHVHIATFASMSNLKILHLNNLYRLRGSCITSSKKLKWLCWNQFPLPYLPADLYMENLVAIDLQYSKLKEIWKGYKRLDKLKFLNLSYSYNLTNTPEFSGLKSLEKLLLHDCTNLVDVHKSIECLDKLLVLDLANCKKLRKIPSSIFVLKSLQHLDLSGYSKLFEQVGSKGTLSMLWQVLVTKPQKGVPVASIQGLNYIRRLNLVDCNMWYVPNEIGSLNSLEFLSLERNRFSNLPNNFNNLYSLKFLYLHSCNQLMALPDLPDNMYAVGAADCQSLEPESVKSQVGKVKRMNFYNCPKLDDNDLRKNILALCQGPEYHFSLPGSDLPSNMQFQGTGSSLSFIVPSYCNGRKIQGCFVGAVVFNPFFVTIRHTLINKTKGVSVHSQKYYGIVGAEKTMWLNKCRLFDGFKLEDNDRVDLVFVGEDYESGLEVESCILSCGMSLVYEDDDKEQEMILCR